MKKILTLLIMGLFPIVQALSQSQPKIMVIPYTKEGEDIRTILEQDENKRVILSKIKEAFDERGFSTIDFAARLKSAQTGEIMQMDNLTDFKDEIISMSGADIYVEAEMICQQNYASGQGKPESRVKITLTAFDVNTGESLSNKIGESGVFYTNDIAKLAMRAVSSVADDFLSVMQSKFSSIAEDGRSVMLTIGIGPESNYTLASEVGADGFALQDEIELWVSDHSVNGIYHLQGASSNRMIFDEIRLPLTDENGSLYNPSKYSMELLRFFRSMKIPVSRTIKGNAIFITIN